MQQWGVIVSIMGKLKLLFWLSLAISLIIVVLFETDVLLSGACADDVNVQFLVVTVVELVTLCCIPLAVRMMRFKKVRNEIKAGRYLKWAFVRQALLSLLLVCNTLLYYIYMNVAFGYMAIIVLLSMIFIFPTMSRMNSETSIEE